MSKRKNFSWLNEQIDPLSTAFALLLFPSLETSKKNQLIYVGLNAESNFLLTQHLINFLDELSFIQLETVNNDNWVNFDLIIATSSYLFPKDCSVPTFVFRYALDNQKQYVELYQILKEIQAKKSNQE